MPSSHDHGNCELCTSLEKRCEELEKCLKDAIPLDEMDAARFQIKTLEKENAQLRQAIRCHVMGACQYQTGLSNALSASERGLK